MKKLTPEQARELFEERVSRIAKSMRLLVNHAPKFVDHVDDKALAKMERFLKAQLGDMMRGVALVQATKPSQRLAFSLDDEQEPEVERSSAPARVTTPAPRPSIPQPVPDEDDDEEDILSVDDEDLDDEDIDLSNDDLDAIDLMTEVQEAQVEATEPVRAKPRRGDKPLGRMVKTKAVVYGKPEEARKASEGASEKPDRNGFIADAGFLDAD